MLFEKLRKVNQMEHAHEVQQSERYYWQELEHYRATMKDLKERLAIESRMVKRGTLSPLNPQYLGLQAVVRKLEASRGRGEPSRYPTDGPSVKPWWRFLQTLVEVVARI